MVLFLRNLWLMLIDKCVDWNTCCRWDELAFPVLRMWLSCHAGMRCRTGAGPSYLRWCRAVRCYGLPSRPLWVTTWTAACPPPCLQRCRKPPPIRGSNNTILTIGIKWVASEYVSYVSYFLVLFSSISFLIVETCLSWLILFFRDIDNLIYDADLQ